MTNTYLRFAQGFDVDSQGFTDSTNGWDGLTTEVATGTNGIIAAEGTGFSIFEQTNGTGPFTRFDGYRALDSNQGFTSTIKIYLDPGSLAAGEGFDYSVAANDQSNAHLRDFIFHVTMDTSSGQLLVGASNNTSFDPREDLETINHGQVTTAGWYTFEHTFFDAGDGTLAVSMSVKNDAGVTLFTEVLNDPTDIFATDFGGNRYGWFTNIDVAGGIAVDDARLLTADQNPVQVFAGSAVIATFATAQDARDAADAGSLVGTSLLITEEGNTPFFYVANGMSIQAAIDAASAGDTIEVANGAYNESLTITKAVTLVGEDVGGDGAPDVFLTPVGANGVDISGDIDGAGAAAVVIDGFDISGAANVGVRVSSTTNLSSLVITNSAFSDNDISGVSAGSGAFDLDSISITNSTFTNNGQGGANGAGDIVLFGFTGDATLQDLTITSTTTAATPDPARGDNAIQITGRDPVTYDVLGPIGAVTLDNVSVDGWYHKPQVLIQGYTDFNNLTLTNVSLTGGTSWGDMLFVDPISTSGDGTPGTPGQPGYFPLTGGTSDLDLSGVTINSGSTAVLTVDSRIRGTDADDHIIGTNGNDLLNDLAENGIDYGGNDDVNGGAGDDILLGASGDDSLAGGADADTLDGGADSDFAVYSDATGGVTVSLATGAGVNDVAQGDVLTNIENLLGGDFDDILTGSDAVANWLDGGGGDDVVDGLSGDDTLIGRNGDDLMLGGDGNDKLFAGIGHDRVDGGLGDDYMRTSNGHDRLIGGDGDDILGGGSGRDYMRGNAGADLMLGSNGTDTLYGDSGNDTMLGGGGRDLITGGDGDDRLVGGAQNDRFHFAPGSGADVIIDFEAGLGATDVIGFFGFGASLDSFAEAIAASTQVGNNVVIDLGGGDSLTLQGVTIAGLDADDFAFG